MKIGHSYKKVRNVKKKKPAGLAGGFLDTKKWVKKINT